MINVKDKKKESKELQIIRGRSAHRWIPTRMDYYKRNQEHKV